MRELLRKFNESSEVSRVLDGLLVIELTLLVFLSGVMYGTGRL